MSKKSFSKGLDSLLGETVSNVSNDAAISESRATFIIDNVLLDKLRAIAYWDRVLIKDVVHDALDSFVINYEKANGVVQAIPKK